MSIPQLGLNTDLSVLSLTPPYQTLLPVLTNSCCPSLLNMYDCNFVNCSNLFSSELSIYANGESEIDTPSFAYII